MPFFIFPAIPPRHLTVPTKTVNKQVDTIINSSGLGTAGTTPLTAMASAAVSKMATLDVAVVAHGVQRTLADLNSQTNHAKSSASLEVGSTNTHVEPGHVTVAINGSPLGVNDSPLGLNDSPLTGNGVPTVPATETRSLEEIWFTPQVLQPPSLKYSNPHRCFIPHAHRTTTSNPNLFQIVLL